MAVFKRKRSSRNRGRGMKRVKRSMNISRPLRGMNGNISTFKRTFWVGTATPSASSTPGFWTYQSWSLSQLPDVANYTALFDQYKINGVKVVYRPRYDGFNGADTTDIVLPGTTAQGSTQAHIIADTNSQVTPSGTYTSTTLNTFMENGNVRTYSGSKAFSVYYRPKIGQSLTTSSTRVTAPWIDTTNSTIPHYGHHLFFTDTGLTGVFNQAFDQYVTFYFQCRGMR